MNLPHQQMTLRKKLTILFILFSIVPMAVVAFYNFREASLQLAKMTHYQLESLCHDRKTQLQLLFKNFILDTRILADHRLVKDMLAEYSAAFLRGGTQGDPLKAVDGLYRKRIADLNEMQGFEDILLVNTAGDVVITFSRGTEWGTNLARGIFSNTNLARCYRRALSQAEVVDFEYFPPIGRAAAFIGSPVLSQIERPGYKAGDLMGVLLVRVPLEQINEITQRENGLGESGEVYIMGMDRTTRSGLRHSIAKGVLSPLEGIQPLGEAFEGRSGYLKQTPDYRGVPVSIAYTPANISGLNWVVFAKKDYAEILKPADVLKGQSLAIGAIVGALSVGICLLVVHGIITPLKRMRLAANRIAEGDLNTRIKIESYGHVGRLAEAFNQMAESLLESRTQLEVHSRSLEQRVEERTAELQSRTRDLEENNLTLEAFAEILGSINAERNLDVLLTRLISGIAARVGALIGILYLYDKSSEHLTPATTYGLTRNEVGPGFRLGMGLPGQAALDGRTLSVTEIPEHYFRISSGSAEGIPGSVLCIPIFFGNDLVGVLELGKIGTFTKADGELLKMIVAQLGIGISNGMVLKALEEMSDVLKENNTILAVQNEELQSQNEEIQSQTEELQSQAEELTAQKQALEEKTLAAAEASHLKSEFVSNISHELRTPLNAILGMTRLLTSGAAGEASARQMEFLEVIERNGRNLLLLINDILDLSRIESGRTEITLSEIPLKAFVLDIAGAARSLIDEKGLALSVDIPEDLTVHSDADKLRQILTNLLSNAVKFTDCGRIIIAGRLENTASDDFVAISVSDTGIGIPGDALDLIFDPFRQVDGSITRKYGGTGLGLHICSKLAGILQGRIAVESSPGKGSVFTLKMPRNRGSITDTDQYWQKKVKDLLFAHIEVAPREAQPASEEEPWGSGRDILLIDDDPIIARELGGILAESGRYRLRSASGGLEGLRKMADQCPNLVILDLNMPDLDGFIVLERMAVELAVDVPVVILTAKNLTERERTRLCGNVRAVVIKGQVDQQTLLRTLDDILNTVEVVREDLPPTPDRCDRERESGTRPPKILIVEDAPDNTVFITESLRPAACDLCTAGDGQQAVQMAEQERPDLILMDLHIPILSGYEAMKRIKEDSNLKHIPIIALTARAMKGDRERIIASGFDDYLAKPIHPDDLLERVHSWLQKLQER